MVRVSNLGGLASFVILGIACSSSRPEGTSGSQALDSQLEQAREVVRIVAAKKTGRCNTCHSASQLGIAGWGRAMQQIDRDCLGPTVTQSPAEKASCLLAKPADPAAGYSPRKLGFYAAGTHQKEFSDLFQAAYPEADWADKYAKFNADAQMPKTGQHLLSTEEFEKIRTWVRAGMPRLAEAWDAEKAAPCIDRVSPELQAHIRKMKTEGWGARNTDNGIVMFGCGAGTNPLECLTTLPDVSSDVAANDVPQTVRKLRDLPFKTHYWVRSSADGRYIGFGLNPTSRVTDLQALADGKSADIEVRADDDPNFLPDNDGFSFAGVGEDSFIHMCKQSALADALEAKASLTFDEPKCMSFGDGAYQSVGASLDGAKYFVALGTHEDDDGGIEQRGPLPASFDGASTSLTPMINDGASYKGGSPIDVKISDEGDVVLSPSGLAMVGRFLSDVDGSAYQLHLVNATPNGASYLVDVPKVAQVCIAGGKASFSFDERVLVMHKYTAAPPLAQNSAAGADDGSPGGGGGADAASGASPQSIRSSSDIMMADLLTGAKMKVTAMKPGQFALYPHFRSDGWLYFLVRDINAGTEYMAATDAALRLPADPNTP